MPVKPSPVWKQIRTHVPIGTWLIGAGSLLLILLKLCNVMPVAHWSWWWVLSPYWLAAAGGLLLMAGMFVVFYFFDR